MKFAQGSETIGEKIVNEVDVYSTDLKNKVGGHNSRMEATVDGTKKTKKGSNDDVEGLMSQFTIGRRRRQWMLVWSASQKPFLARNQTTSPRPRNYIQGC